MAIKINNNVKLTPLVALVADQLQGDSIYLAGESHGADQLFGEGGDDSLWGQGGDDFLEGGSGNDHLEGDLPCALPLWKLAA